MKFIVLVLVMLFCITSANSGLFTIPQLSMPFHLSYDCDDYLYSGSIYHATSDQTDDTPNITADGTVIDTNNVADIKYVAISRNMHSMYGGIYGFGDTILVNFTCEDEPINSRFNGKWVIRDLMNSRFINKLDFLVEKSSRQFSYVSCIEIVKR